MQLHLRQYFNSNSPAKITYFRQKLPQRFVEKIVLKNETYQSSISPWVSNILYPVGCFGILPLFFEKIEISGLENIPPNCPVILAPTHRSRWDGILVTFATGKLTTGRDLHYMVSADELTGIQGWIIRKMGGFPVNIRSPKVGTFRQSVELLQQNKMLVIFPEGGIFQDGKIHNLKNGLARIALKVETKQPKSNVKIIPIAINYSENIPTWGSEVEIKIGQSLNVAEYTRETLKKSTKKLTQDLKNCLQELDQEMVKI